MKFTERKRNIVTGAIGSVILIALLSLGIKSAFGAFDTGYEVTGDFAAAGQGLLAGSDVKVRGINVGEVTDIELVDNRALITVRINHGVDIPVDAHAVIRPKTLFGEKFVDVIPCPAPDGDTNTQEFRSCDSEQTGPFLAGLDEDDREFARAIGGFELERVLADTYPVLDAINVDELAIVISELAASGEGLGDEISNSIINSERLTALQVENDAELRQFLGDLALVSEQLAGDTDELLRSAEDLNAALPSLNARSDDLNTALVQLARLSGDLSTLIDANLAFTTNALTNGTLSLQLLFTNREQVQPVLQGLEDYTSTLSRAIRFDADDGSMLAAVKNLISVDDILGGLTGGASLPAASSSGGPAPSSAPPAPETRTAPAEDPIEALVNDVFGLLAGGVGQ